MVILLILTFPEGCFENFSFKMAINKNHEFEELNGVKCAIVEKNVRQTELHF